MSKFVVIVETSSGVGDRLAFGTFDTVEQAKVAVPIAVARVPGWVSAEVIEVKELEVGEAPTAQEGRVQ